MTPSENAAKAHPKGLYILFATEMWERFNFYGLRAMLILFMTKALLFDKVFASNVYGSYLSLIYLTPLVGGFMADRYWGNRRSILSGGVVMAIGEIILFACGTVYHTLPQLATLLFFSGLGFMIAGNGFFKPNISIMVGELYPKGDRRKDAAYTLFYMGINTGGMLGPLVCGLVGDTGNPADYRWAFLVAGIGMMLSIITLRIFNHRYVVTPEKKVLGLTPEGVTGKIISPVAVVGILLGMVLLSIGLIYADDKVFPFLSYLLIAAPVAIALIIFSDKSLTAIQKRHVGVIFIVCFFVIFFWAAFEQAGDSLTFFADEQTQRTLNWHIPTWAIYITLAVLFYVIIVLFRRARKKLAGPDDALLRGTVFLLLGLFTVAVWGVGIYLATTGKRSVVLGEVPPSVFQSLNSFFVVAFAPFFAWLWQKLGKWEPGSPTKMAFGLFFLALGYLWISYGVKDVPPGIKVSMIWLTGMYALHTCGELCLSPIGLSLVNQLAPVKFASLLMAVWFMANAMGNKLAGVLSTFYPEKGKTTAFLGYHMSNLNEFFMLFVFMAGAASLLLFFVSRRTERMMKHEQEVAGA
ncbi:peptide MFS transporter [Dinghuibacter silviterrae]|uniref:POT family proton-dependent oligopeptide transporter n=1 Tax=Dinghuibacter silviterrae TaxID=1539049 RepID=A0A4R8DPQ9_9BACT|nr:peptide MFS transporter [Dinghuibacter silviterrae]TDX00110.1 POT family proton-dependent oligopeptide transporter [Dinghuibacter silviterrae]